MEAAKQHLANHHVRPSMQRIAIMKYLMEHRTHPTVDTIYNDLLPSIPTLSRTTVYNTLELFSAKHAVLALTIDKRNVRYDACTIPHAHFMCRKCGHVFDVELDAISIELLYNTDEFLVEKVELNSVGLCPDCRKEEEEN